MLLICCRSMVVADLPEMKSYREETIMFCPNCGKEIKNPKAFCPACGTSLEKYKAAFSQEMTD